MALNKVGFIMSKISENYNVVRKGMPICFWWESQREEDRWEDQDVGGWILER
jgi:hypothetical protein